MLGKITDHIVLEVMSRLMDAGRYLQTANMGTKGKYCLTNLVTYDGTTSSTGKERAMDVIYLGF